MSDSIQARGDIVAMDACALSQAIHAKKVSCVEVMRATLDQIERLNPIVNAIVSLRDRGALLQEAEARDAELAQGGSRGWMHGFPQAIKDLAAARGIPMTQGSPFLKNQVPETDAIFVERVKAAGAIVIGKTNVPEFGLGSHTYNPVFGATLNPYDQSKVAGGSSGGAGVALALRMLPVADGSDHGGSLRNPAAYNNVLGLRPSYGRVPSHTEEVFLPQLTVAGPMARKVADLAMLLSVQAGHDPRVPLSIQEDPVRFTQPLSRDFKGSRIGWIGDYGGHLPFEAGILDLCRAALKRFEEIGCIVEEVVPDFPAEEIWQNWLILRGWQAGGGLRAYYEDPQKREQMKPAARYEVEQGLKVSAFDVTRASAVRTAWYHVVRRLFERYDYLLLPSAQVFPFDVTTDWPKEIAGRPMDTYHRWMEVMIPVTMAGCPAISVPVGFGANGLPMGLQVMGPNQGEFQVLQLAYAYEQATRWVDRHPPPLLAGGSA